jgi:hypothetical protein
MSFRRAVVAVAVLASAIAAAVVPAGADQGVVRSVPIHEWFYPGTAELDGVGGWVYVDPPGVPGPNQVSNRDYVYEELFGFTHGGHGAIGLGADAGGPLVGLRLDPPGAFDPAVPPVTVRYAWQPGRIYFLLAYVLGAGQVGGWVYDLGAATWTYFGSIQAPPTWGKLAPGSAATVHGARGLPLPSPFSPEPLSTPGVADCSQFPLAGVWFSQPYGWRGTTLVLPDVDANDPAAGCPTGTETANGWFHQTMGTAPTA